MKCTPLTIIISDDQALIRNGLVKLLQSEDGMELLAEADNNQNLEKLCFDLYPDVVIAGARLYEKNDIEAIRKIATAFPRIKIIVLIDASDTATSIAIKDAGATALLCRSATEDEIIKTIEAVSSDAWHCDNKKQHINKSYRIPTRPLTGRETDILKHVCEDLTAKEIGAKLTISARTVEKFRQNIMQKVSVKGNAGLTLLPSMIDAIYS